MAKPDILSQRPDHQEGVENDNSNIVLLTAEHIAYLRTIAIDVETVGDQIVKDLRQRNPVPINTRDKANWEQKDGITYRDGLIVIQNPDLKLKILQSVHDSAISGHPGRAKTRELITRDFWWSGLTQYVNKYVDGCSKCQRNKVFPQKPQGELRPHNSPDRPFQKITMDFITDLPESQGYNSIMAVVDRFGKRAYFIPCHKTIKSEGVAKLFRDNIWRHEGFPETIISDRDSKFVSEFTVELNKLLGIKQNISTAYHPETDGQTERLNQEIEAYLRIFINWHQNDWSSWLPTAEFAYNNRIHSAIGRSPFNVTKGYDVNSGIQPTKDKQSGIGYKDFVDNMLKIREETKACLNRAAKDMKKFYDRKHKPAEYNIGDKVWLNMKDINTG
jgi:Integrase zinc binding domain/Integrase core domain